LPDTIGNLDALQTLNLSKNTITELPYSIGDLTSLQTLNLSENRLSSVSTWIGNLENLVTLHVDRNTPLTSLPEEINNLSSLTHLYAYSGSINTLPTTRSWMTSLIYLWLYQNKLTTLSTGIGYLPSLQELVIHNNKLTTLPDTIGNITTLKHLVAYGNYLWIIPPWVTNLSNLLTLDLSHNYINTIPWSISGMASIETINLWYNNLSFADIDSLRGLNTLKILFLNNNNLSGAIPSSIGNLNNLLILYMSDNNINSIPKEFTQLTNLVWVDMQKNKITTLPNDIGVLSKLQVLNISDNQLAGTLPESMGNLNNMIWLYLNNNLIQELPWSLWHIQMKTNINWHNGMYLQNNNITSIPVSFGNLSVRTLNISNNNISSIPPYFGNSNIENLNISHNYIVALPPTLVDIWWLRHFDFSYNSVGEVPTTFSNMNLETLTLTQNCIDSGEFFANTLLSDWWYGMISSPGKSAIGINNQKTTCDLAGFTISKGKIVEGLTWENKGNTYFRDAIKISANVNYIGNSILNTGSCEYTINWWNTRIGATYTGNGISGYCYTDTITPVNDIHIIFRIKDMFNIQVISNINTYYYDAIGPSSPILIYPLSWDILLSFSTSLIRSDVVDAGIGIDYYVTNIYSWNNPNIWKSITWVSTWLNLTWLSNYTWYYRDVTAYDRFWNTWNASTLASFFVEIPPPLVDTWYIISGITGDNLWILYYKWPIDIRANLTWYNISWCEYNITGVWVSANTWIWYCEANGLDPLMDIAIQFRAENEGGVTTWGITYYFYDASPPTQVELLLPLSWSYLPTWAVLFVWSAAVDTWIWLAWYYYDVLWSWYHITGNTLNTWFNESIPEWTYQRSTYAYDALSNTGLLSNIWTFTIIFPPTVSTGYISSGVTQSSWWNTYYKWIVDIRADMTGMDISSCEWTTGAVIRHTGIVQSDYCEAINLALTENIDVQFRATNSWGTVTWWSTQYIYDSIPPSVPEHMFPSDSYLFTGNIFTLLWTASDDNSWGIGVSGYIYTISLDPLFTTSVYSWFVDTTWVNLSGTEATYYRRVQSVDFMWNISDPSTWSSFVIHIPPTVSTWYISSWLTGERLGTLYYKWIVDIRADMTGTDISSCEYSISGVWLTADVHSTYCQATGIVYTWNIDVQFRATNTGWIVTWGITSYVYDDIAPSKVVLLTPISGAVNVAVPVIATREQSVETWVGIEYYHLQIYSDSWLTISIASWTGTATGVSIWWLAYDTTYYRNVYAVDRFANTGDTSDAFVFTTQSQPIPPSGWGWWSIIKDNCCIDSSLPWANAECIDHSPSFYDGTCESFTQEEHKAPTHCDYYPSQELNDAYGFAYQYGITTIDDCKKANANGPLIRIHMAKMMSQFAQNVLKKKIDNNMVCELTDIDKVSKELQYYAILSCKLWLMWLNPDGTPNTVFNPNDVVTRNMFGTAFSRMIYGDKYNIKTGEKLPWYSKHLQALNKAWIMKKIENPWQTELRWWTWLMMKRADESWVFMSAKSAISWTDALID